MAAPLGATQGQTSQHKGIRVCVRVRPVTGGDGDSPSCTLLTCDCPARTISLGNQTDKRAAKSFKFDAVFKPDTTQEELYKSAGIEELVTSAASGYHATVFAYGQTGSGKTHTMEGFKYISQGLSPTASLKSPAPHADFDNTPAAQLGIVPRATRALFDALAACKGRRATVRASFVQLYKEQAYDLLNPTPLALMNGPARPTKPGAPPAPGGALRMRWSKVEEFYLENLFKVECSSPEEVMAAFKSGVANKVMASHRLNAASSRSHALFTLYIDTAPAASPNEIISSRLTLVDLAGSERQSSTGATEGTLRDESVAINKSLFTLRQVIIALSSPGSGAASGESPGGTERGGQGTTHVPYRDSKLTALLKNSLGGNSLTTMIACVSPADGSYEENMSTLEYAARAKRVTNQVSLNEDPKTRLIRELRAEVAFLRQQLALAQGAAAPSLHMSQYSAASPPPGVAALLAQAVEGGSSTQRQGQTSSPRTNSSPGHSQQHDLAKSGSTAATAPSTPNHATAQGLHGAKPHAGKGSGPRSEPGAGSDGRKGSPGTASAAAAAVGDDSVALPAGVSIDAVRQQVLRSAQQDAGVLAQKFLDAVGLVQQLSAVNSQLRVAYDAYALAGEELRIENDDLMMENAKIRDRLSMLEALVGVQEGEGGGSHAQHRPGGSPAAGTPKATPGDHQKQGQMLTAGSSALIELQELRRENALLHERLRTSEGSQHLPALLQPGQAPSATATRRLPASGTQPQQRNTQPRRPAGTAGSAQGRVVQSGARAAAGPTGTRLNSAQEGVLASMPPSTLTVAELRNALAGNGSQTGSPRTPSPMASDALVQATHRVASRALGAGVRMTTVGHVLPGAAARAQAGSTDAVPRSPANVLSGSGETMATPLADQGDDPAARLGQLMAARSVLSRQRLGDAG